MVTFDYRSGILEAADTKTGYEWCWFKWVSEITRRIGGELTGSISVPPDASVVAVKTIIRGDAKR